MIQTKNYLVKKELKKEMKRAAGLVSDRFPNVSGIVVYMKYYGEVSNRVLMVRTIYFFPSSYAFFDMECMTKDCVDGGFDLTPMILNLIKNHRKSGKGKMICKGKIDQRTSHHASVSYDINIKYRK